MGSQQPSAASDSQAQSVLCGSARRETGSWRPVFLSALLLFSLFTDCAATDSRFSSPSAKVINCLIASGAAGQNGPGPLQLEWTDIKSFNPQVLGFNPSFRATTQGNGNFETRSMLHLLDIFPVYALRFPPGTYSSFYNWRTETIDEPLAREYDNEAMLHAAEHQRAANGHLIKSNYHSFLSLTSAHHITPFIVLNLYTQGSKGAEQTVDRVQKLGTTLPVRWELGNELANYPYRREWHRPWNSDIYLKRALATAAYIRRRIPGARLGVDAAEPDKPRGFSSIPMRVAGYNKDWNSRIASHLGDFNAVIFHPYLNFLPQVIERGLRQRHIDNVCPSDGSAAMRSAVDYRWAFSAAQGVPLRYRDYVDAYFPGKTIWLTELGLVGAERTGALDFGPSGILRSLFNLSYFAHWIEAFPNIGAYMFHVLSYGRGPFAAIYPDGSFNSNSVSYVFLRHLLDGATGVGVQTFGAGATVSGVGPYRHRIIKPVIAILARTPTSRRVLVLNIGFSALHAKSPFLAARVTAVGGLPLATFRPGLIRDFHDFPYKIVKSGSITLLPASITLIEDANSN